MSPAALLGLVSAALLAVFAFIGFEAIVNMAEELHEPQRALPRAISLTLALTTLLYVLVVWVALVAVPPAELAAARAPLALAFERLTGASSGTMSAIAVVATLNGIIVQIILSSRVLYGLARQGTLPLALQEVSPLTRTPLIATAVTVTLVLAFVAVAEASGELLGVVRFVADPDYVQGEYAILVRSYLKGHGLGWRLMQHLIAYARAEKLEQLYACVLAENTIMLRMCREFGFSVEPEPGDAGVRRVVLRLT